MFTLRHLASVADLLAIGPVPLGGGAGSARLEDAGVLLPPAHLPLIVAGRLPAGVTDCRSMVPVKVLPTLTVEAVTAQWPGLGVMVKIPALFARVLHSAPSIAITGVVVRTVSTPSFLMFRMNTAGLPTSNGNRGWSL